MLIIHDCIRYISRDKENRGMRGIRSARAALVTTTGWIVLTILFLFSSSSRTTDLSSACWFGFVAFSNIFLLSPRTASRSGVYQWTGPMLASPFWVDKWRGTVRNIKRDVCRINVLRSTQGVAKASILVRWRELLALAFRICMGNNTPPL